MTIESAFLELMPSTVTVYGKSSMDAYGKITPNATGTAVRCRIQQRNQRYSTENNRDEFENGTIIFYGSVDITMESKIVLPDGSSPIILSVVTHNDDEGFHHTTVTFGK